MLLTREELNAAIESGIPVRVENPNTETILIRPNPNKDEGVMQWEGKQRDGTTDSLLIDPEQLKIPQLVKAFATGMLQPVLDEDPYVALAAGTLTQFVSPTIAGAARAAEVKRSTANTKATMRTCVMPESGGVCGAPAPLAVGSNPDEVPPLCSGHIHAATRFVPRHTGRILGSGAQEVGWYHK